MRAGLFITCFNDTPLLTPTLVQPGSSAAELYLENSGCLIFFSTLACPPEPEASPSLEYL